MGEAWIESEFPFLFQGEGTGKSYHQEGGFGADCEFDKESILCSCRPLWLGTTWAGSHHLCFPPTDEWDGDIQGSSRTEPARAHGQRSRGTDHPHQLILLNCLVQQSWLEPCTDVCLMAYAVCCTPPAASGINMSFFHLLFALLTDQPLSLSWARSWC